MDICKYKRGDKEYKRVLLREAYRENGKVKKRTIANLSGCTDEQIKAIKYGLDNTEAINNNLVSDISQAESGKIVGAVAALYQAAGISGITNALGNTASARLSLAMIISRLINQGSRLSCVELARNHTLREILGLPEFTEDHLYDAMDWLTEHQENIEKKLFSDKATSDTIYLYDVSSTYLEGTQNELADYGYNRDKKIGKMQIVYGLLTSSSGEPLSIETFPGNTRDHLTVKNQIEKLQAKFGCSKITFVGDKGMLKSAQITDLQEHGFNYITTISKPEINTLLKNNILQMELFDSDLMEVTDDGIRYIFRRNPIRAKEIRVSREQRTLKIQAKIKAANDYLTEHPKAKPKTQLNILSNMIARYEIKKFAVLELSDRKISLIIDQVELTETAKLDGCYVMKTDLPEQSADKETIHKRYKDLALVEHAFRTCKTDWLEAQPVFVRKENRTRAHLFIIMLAYKIAMLLERSWADLNVSAKNGVKTLSTISSVVCKVGQEKVIKVPKPSPMCKSLLEKLKVVLPDFLPVIT
jgi:transposase